jgi:hypothetical protein
MVHRINLVAEVFESADLETYLCFRRKVFHLPTIQNGLIYSGRKIELNSPTTQYRIQNHLLYNPDQIRPAIFLLRAAQSLTRTDAH